MNARVYDPDIGRFLSPDPTVPYTHNPQSFNRYSYVQNNPLNRFDPDGFNDNGAQTTGQTPEENNAPPQSGSGNNSTASVTTDGIGGRGIDAKKRNDANGLDNTTGGFWSDFVKGLRYGRGLSVLDPSHPRSNAYGFGSDVRQWSKETFGVQDMDDAKKHYDLGNGVRATMYGLRGAGAFATGLTPFGAARGAVTKGVLGGRVSAYEVAPANVLRARSVPGDGLDIHHAMQKGPAGQIIDGYNPNTAPAIAVPATLHENIPTIRGPFEGNARGLLAKDIRDLRNKTDAPNSALRELVNLNKQMYPGSFDRR
jgi:hypothetical protein